MQKPRSHHGRRHRKPLLTHESPRIPQTVHQRDGRRKIPNSAHGGAF